MSIWYWYGKENSIEFLLETFELCLTFHIFENIYFVNIDELKIIGITNILFQIIGQKSLELNEFYCEWKLKEDNIFYDNVVIWAKINVVVTNRE